jgi:DNA-binding response OmpR family regulator
MKVLIVEEDPEVSSQIRGALDKIGYYTTVCRDGSRALRLAESGIYGAIVTELRGSTIDGIEFCKKLRTSGVGTPVLIVSSRSSVVDRVLGLESGADDYLVKPFDLSELIARVRALLRRDHSRKQSYIRIEDLEVDTLNRRVKRAGVPIVLTSREYALLEALATHAGEALSRKTIMERVWVDARSVSNTVDVYIKKLRRKVDGRSERPLIRTIYGLGYMIRGDDDEQAAA